VLPLWLTALGAVAPGLTRADDTNGILPTVSVRTDRNATVTDPLPGIFTIERTGDTSRALAVNYCVSGDATNGVDYQRLPGMVTIPAGQSSAPIEINPLNLQQEGDVRKVTLTLLATNPPFTLVVLPDTQCYTREINGATRDIFTAQTRWIAEHKDALNIAFVLHEGDLTDGNSAPEWTNAAASMSVLDGVVPYALAVGNHDGLMSGERQTGPFNQFFPVSRYQDLPTFGGVFESNRLDNSYHLFRAGGVDWLVLSLEFGPRDSVLTWASQVAGRYPDRRVILLTHTHVYSDNTLHGSSTNQAWLPTSYGRPNNGTDVWEKFLRRLPNAALAFNGHVLNSGVGRLVGAGDYGNRVFQMLANYQMQVLGGAGYLRLIQFSPGQDKMSVSAYSPYLDSSLTDGSNQFEYANLGIFSGAEPGYLVDPHLVTATLTITNDYADLAPPVVSAVTCGGIPPVLRVSFDEPVEQVSAETSANYSLDQGVPLTGATLLPDGRTVALATDPALTAGTIHSLSVNHVKDRARATNEMLTPATIPFTYVPAYLTADFADKSLAGWTVVDEGTTDGPSRWLARSGRLLQLSNIHGPGAFDHRQGTFLYWNDPAALRWSNYTCSVAFNTPDDDGVGLLFRYQNPSNYYKVDLDAQRNFRKVFRLADGIETILATEPGGYVTGSNYVLRLEVTNSEITVLLNGDVRFGGPVTDGALAAGTVALYAWGSQGVCFSNLNVSPLQRWPRATIQSPTDGTTVVLPASIPVAVDAFSPDGQVQAVKLFNGPSLLATLTNEPYLFQWTNLWAGTFTLTAMVMDDSGRMGYSRPVGLTVAPPPPLPIVTQQPSNQTVHMDSAAFFSIRACGSPPLAYQWLFNGEPIPAATNSFLLLDDVQAANAGNYTIRVANPWGTNFSQSAILTVNPMVSPAAQTSEPARVAFAGLEILEPGMALVSVRATNLIGFRVDWSSNCLSWAPLLTLTNYGDPLYFIDPDALRQPCRFYRAAAP